MPWLWFSAALLVVSILQSTVMVHAWSTIDLYIILTIVWALSAPTYDARVAGWIIGLVQDLGTVSPLGLHAFALGLTALAVTILRENIFRQTLYTRSVVGAVGALPGVLLVPIHLWFVHNLPTDGFWRTVVYVVLTPVFSAVIAAAILELPNWTGRSRRFAYSRRYD